MHGRDDEAGDVSLAIVFGANERASERARELASERASKRPAGWMAKELGRLSRAC